MAEKDWDFWSPSTWGNALPEFDTMLPEWSMPDWFSGDAAPGDGGQTDADWIASVEREWATEERIAMVKASFVPFVLMAAILYAFLRWK